MKNVVVNILMMFLCTGCFFGESNMDNNFRPGAKYPMVDSLSPAVGSTEGGTTVTISGNYFDENVVVTVDSEPCESLAYISSTSLLCVVPAHEAGSVDLVVSNPELSTTFPGMISYRYPAPRVSGISPFSGGISGGTLIVVSGSGFRAGAVVMLGDTACTQVAVTSSTSLSCVTPTHVDGAVDVAVTNSDDQSATSVNGFTFVPPFAPAVTGISPSVGGFQGGTPLTITGTNFVGGASVALGGSPCESVSVASATRITCTVAPHSAGLVDVVVTNADGSGAATATNVFRYMGLSPSITAVVPAGGPLAGGTAVLIAGNYFEQGVQVTFGGNPCTTIVVGSSTSITCNTPAQGAGAKDVVVTNSDGQSATLNSGFTYYSAPSISSIAPSSGGQGGGTLISISGGNFSNPTVSVGGSNCPLYALGSAVIFCTTAAHATGSVNVVVTNGDGQSATAPNGFSYGDASGPPTVSVISPTTGYTLGGITATITGAGFQAGLQVTIGGGDCTESAITDATTIICRTPFSQTTGAKDIVVTNADTQSGTLSGGFTYEYAPPTVSGVSPSTGSVAGGEMLTITGTNFRSGCAAKVGGIDCLATSFSSATTVLCTTPPHTVGAKEVTVTNDDGKNDTLSGAFVYGPTVTLVSPNSGGVMGDTSVTITGENFTGGPGFAVTFGGQAAANAVVVNAQTITCLTPSGTAGAKDVVVTNSDMGAGTKSGGFTYVATSWSATSVSAAPNARYGQTAVWTGTVMIIWGGRDEAYLNTGGIYDPLTDSWTPTQETGAPSGRMDHTAVWTGGKMIIWGGIREGNALLGVGGIYDPLGNNGAGSWTDTSTVDSPPGTHRHTAIWTGTKMIVFGGFGLFADGKIYNLGSNTWENMTSCSRSHIDHTAVWTGAEMIVWGGGVGDIYNVAGDSWTQMPTSDAPDATARHTAVWTGSKMIVWGGMNAFTTPIDTGSVYDVTGRLWTPTSMTNAPTARQDHTAVWTGTKMVVWGGGEEGAGVYKSDGGIYDLASNSWTATSTTNVPTVRSLHTAVWTGSSMIIWGGMLDISSLDTGGKYTP